MKMQSTHPQPAVWNNETYLLQQFQQGNNRAFYLLFKAHYASLCHFAHYLVNNKEDAEDIVSQAFLKLWLQCSTFNSIDSIKPFLVVVIRNACFDYLKHHKVKAKAQRELVYTAARSEDDIQAQLMKAEVLQKAVQQIDKLPVRMQKVFKLAYGAHALTNTEIAARLNITESTVRVQKAKAIQVIKQALKHEKLLVVVMCLLQVSCYLKLAM